MGCGASRSVHPVPDFVPVTPKEREPLRSHEFQEQVPERKGTELDEVEEHELDHVFRDRVPERKGSELDEVEDDVLESVNSMDMTYEPSSPGPCHPCPPSWVDQCNHDERLAARLRVLCWQPKALEAEVRDARLRFIQRSKWREQSEVKDISPDMSRRSTQASLLLQQQGNIATPLQCPRAQWSLMY
eukprot:TRINITY_DN45105_c0_g1_i1.p1 TRINITY_DN45105_c0_g1~~TRINITY_DN45105_c0_g1_i1.p1  ORF type:complete len:187 (+),score=20.15 TRINITY_DN45105_c0_g1_i1:105-665(+)